MFHEMNHYVKLTHGGDSLIWSGVVQSDIMSRNYNLIKTNHHRPLATIHNPEWINDDVNSLPDTLKNKIIQENANPQFLESIFLKCCDVYAQMSYMEILQSSSYPSTPQITYQEIARGFISNWNSSPAHAGYMNANYRSKVLCGVSTFYNISTRTIFISFVYVSWGSSHFLEYKWLDLSKGSIPRTQPTPYGVNKLKKEFSVIAIASRDLYSNLFVEV